MTRRGRINRTIREPWARRVVGSVIIIALAVIAAWRLALAANVPIPRVDPGPIVLAICLTPISLSLLGLRLRIILAAAHHALGTAASVQLAAAGYLFNASTPAGLGEVGRIALMRQRYRIPLRVGAGSVIYERGMSLGVTTAMTVLLLSLTVPSAEADMAPALMVGASVVLAAGAVVFVTPVRRSVEGVAARFMRRLGERLHLSLRSMIELLDKLLRDPVLAASFALLTACTVGVYGMQLWLALQAIGIDRVGPVLAVGLFGVASLAGILSAIPFGVGSADAVLMVGLLAVGVSPPLVAAAAVLLRLVNTGPLLLAGVAAALHLHVSSVAPTGEVTQTTDP